MKGWMNTLLLNLVKIEVNNCSLYRFQNSLLGRRRNENIYKPVKLSNEMVEVFQAAVHYHPPNDVRSLLAKYKKKLLVTKTFILYFFTKLFKVVNKMTIPDGPLVNLLGSDESFKSIQLFKLLKLAKHI